MLSACFFLMFFMLLRLPSTILLLVLETEGSLMFEMADTTINILDVIAIADHCLHGGTTSRNTPE